MDKTKVTKDLEAKTLTIERTFDAPKEKLWNAYANKDVFTAWWGPEGWNTTVKEFDFTAGGRVHYIMKCVDENQGEFFGQEAPGLMEITSVDEPNGFSYQDFFADADGNKKEDMPALKIEVSFVENDGKTTVVSRSQAKTAKEIEDLLAMGMAEGYSSSCDRLERLLAQQ